MADYALVANWDGVHRNKDHVNIPNDMNNKDWIEYQQWVMAGGVPDPVPMTIGSSQYDWGPKFFEVIGRY